MKVLFIFLLLLYSGRCGSAQDTGDPLRPFSAITTSTIQSSTGVFQLRGRYAQSSEGSSSFVRENDPPANDAGLRGEFFYIVNLKERLFIRGDSLILTAVSTPLIGQADLKNIQPYHTCKWLVDGTWRVIGEDTIKGIPVKKVIDEETRTEELTRVITLWVAPSLNCFQMRRTHIKNGVTVEEDVVDTLTLEEPPAGTFAVPAGYDEVSPVEYERRYRVKFPGRQLMSDEIVQRLERRHQEAVEKFRKSRQ